MYNTVNFINPLSSFTSTMTEDKITRKTTLGEAIAKVPEANRILFEYGLHCIGCHIAAYESIEDGCRAHGMTEEQIDEIVEKINKVKDQEVEE